MNYDLSAATWRKASYSDGNGGNCLEVADGLPVVPVRDSKDIDRTPLRFAPETWAAFVASLKALTPSAPAGVRPAPAGPALYLDELLKVSRVSSRSTPRRDLSSR